LRICSFVPRKEDRLIICSDGITQSGLGGKKYLFGWGRENLEEYLLELVNHDKLISAPVLASKVVNLANINDDYHSKDDSSCAVIYFRQPRKLLICTGPPFDEAKDIELGEKVKNFEGKKIICGATTGDIIARELNLEIKDSFDFEDPDLPPISFMPGIDLVTEGILTLGKVTEILKKLSQQHQTYQGVQPIKL